MLSRCASSVARIAVLFALLFAAASAVAGDAAPPYAASEQNRVAAAEAFQEIDKLLAEASRLSGLPIRGKVKSAVASKGQIENYLKQRMAETADEQRQHGEELALKKFGFLPPDYNLKSATLQLLTEQAAAYYDPRRKEIFIADWTPIAVQRPAIVHELTHALQDQQVNLDQFMNDKMGEDEEMARSAVVEGQAVVVMMQYLLAQSGMSLDALPNMGELVSQATLAEVNQFPVFSAAPAYLRESLLFPYTAGMDYARWMEKKYGKDWFGVIAKNPPGTSSQILHPGSAAPEGLDQVQVPDVGHMPAGYQKAASGMLGEFDVRVLLKQYCGAETADRIAPGWRGLRYAVYENRREKQAFLVHTSRWKDAATAADFAAAYKKVIAAKGEKNARVEVAGNTVSIYEGIPKQQN